MKYKPEPEDDAPEPQPTHRESAEAPERRDPNCPTCHGTGWQIADSSGQPWTIEREMSEPQTEWRARRCSRGCIPRGGEVNRTEAA